MIRRDELVLPGRGPTDLGDTGLNDIGLHEAMAARSFPASMRFLTISGLAAFPIIVALAVALRDHLSPQRVMWWVGFAGIAELLMVWLRLRHDRSATTLHPLAAITVIVHAALWGAATLVPAPGEGTTALLLLLLPFCAAGLYVEIFATSRRLFYVALSVTMAIGGLGLALQGTQSGRTAGAACATWALLTVAFHHIAHRSATRYIEVQRQSDELVSRLQSERGRLAEANLRLKHQATHDPLSGLLNRRGTAEALDALLMACLADETSLSVLYVDVDQFKIVNDSLGHRAGDVVLQAVAERLHRLLPDGAFAGRLGGDELVVAIPRCNEAGALVVAADILVEVGRPIDFEEQTLNISVSVGIGIAPKHDTRSDELLRCSNLALHHAKATGRNRVEVFRPEMTTRVRQRAEQEWSLNRATARGDVKPYFQPEFDVHTGRIVGVQILPRWIRRDGDMLALAKVLSGPTDVGLLDRVSESFMQNTRGHVLRFMEMLPDPDVRFRIVLPIAIALKRHADERIDGLLGDVPLERMVLGISSAAVGTRESDVAPLLEALVRRGARICLDDLGRGAGLLSTLRNLPVGEARLDHQTVGELGAHPKELAVIRSVIKLVHDMDLMVSAAGVTKAHQERLLTNWGCTRLQGPLFAPALATIPFEDFLRSHVESFKRVSLDAVRGRESSGMAGR